jgi:glutamine synthetase adenylyltransferase
MAKKNAEVNEQELQAAEVAEQSETVEGLTVDLVNTMLEEIRSIVEEKHPVVASEDAHRAQDQLLKEVLEAVANGANDAEGLAKAALLVFDIEFTRWFA